jgi:hypothetical protein
VVLRSKNWGGTVTQTDVFIAIIDFLDDIHCPDFVLNVIL